MTTHPTILALTFLATFATAATAALALEATDPISACRAAHGGDSGAHIACLEDALRARMPAAPVAPVDAGSPGKVPAPAAAPVAAPVAAMPAEPTGLGAEQARARQKPLDAPPEMVEVRIVASGYNAEGLGTFRMADGQVWRETTPAPKRHKLKPGQEYAARIETSKLGGYRLYVEGRTWMYKVQRLK